jgi:lysophospholipase L1-like esterase
MNTGFKTLLTLIFLEMKNLLPILFIGLIFTSAAQDIRYDTIRYAKKHYAKRVALFNNEPVRKEGIIFLGNSIMEFGDWGKLLNDTTVVNRGIAADNTFGVLDRLEDVIIRRPSKLFIEIGINDISQNIPLDVIVQNISKIVERVRSKSPGTKIYVHSILPTNDNVKNEYPDAFNKNAQTDLLNEQLRRKARENKFAYIDLNKELRDANGKLEVKYAEPDGLHLNNQGYQVWVRLLKEKKYI